MTPPHPLVMRGRAAFESGDISAALILADMRLKDAPEDDHALQLKAYVERARGNSGGAENLMRRAIAADPASPWALNDLTELLHGTGRPAKAETAARAAVHARPDDARAHLQLAFILGEKDDLPAAERHNRRAMALAGPHPQILSNLALTLYNQGRPAEAVPLLTQALAERPDDAQLMAHLSRAHEALRDMDQAWTWLERAETAGHARGEDFTLLRALYLSNAGRDEEALTVIDAAPGGRSASARLDRARILDRLGRADEAWPEMVAAKADLGRQMGIRYDAKAVAADVDARIATFGAQALASRPRASVRADVPQPVFILGFPRSGTTLIEQMLSAHPQIAAGGELPFVHEWRGLSGEGMDPERLRDHYLARAKDYNLAGPAPLFTDKMPLNDVDLPLIRLAFPQAPVIRMVRHPLDVALSMLSHNLTHGEGCGYAIETIFAHMHAMQRLNAHYDAVLEPPLVVRYEDLVADPEGGIRRVLGHIGLDFDAACLRFHESRRHAQTPSYAQVTKPLNDRSIGRWKAYRSNLVRHMGDMASLIAALGYTA